jgi:hypothetical protein
LIERNYFSGQRYWHLYDCPACVDRAKTPVVI